MQKVTDINKVKTLSIVSLYECETSRRARNVKAGKSLANCCPFCGSGTKKNKSGAMELDSGKNLFHCYSCHAAGSVIDFVAKLHNLGVYQAAVYINDNYFGGLATKDYDKPLSPNYKSRRLLLQTASSSDEEDTSRPPDGEVNAKLFELVSGAKGCADCLAYLDARGFTQDIRQRWSIRTVRKEDINGIKNELVRLFGLDRLRAAGVVSGERDAVFFWAWRILIFNRNKDGGFLNIRARALPSDIERISKATNSKVDKYHGMKNIKIYPFATSSIYTVPRGSAVCLVEGELDAVAANEIYCGEKAAVAIGGSSTNKKAYVGLLERIARRGLVVNPIFDRDKGGDQHLAHFQQISKEVNGLIKGDAYWLEKHHDYGDLLASQNISDEENINKVEYCFKTAGSYAVADIARNVNLPILKTRRALMDFVKYFAFDASFSDSYDIITIH